MPINVIIIRHLIYTRNSYSLKMLPLRYKHIFANQPLQDLTEKGKMKRLLNVIKLLKLDVQNGIQFYDEMFDR